MYTARARVPRVLQAVGLPVTTSVVTGVSALGHTGGTQTIEGLTSLFGDIVNSPPVSIDRNGFVVRAGGLGLFPSGTPGYGEPWVGMRL